MDWLFPEPIHEITIEGLKDRLRDVPEGLYVEYKGAETIGQTDDIAKAIAAFANTHGGWLFLGIEEDTNNDNRPKEDGFCGIRMADAETQRMYHIATDHLDPGPQIAVAAVALSDAEASNRIIAIHVAESDDPPLIRRKDGRVYVRTGNTSRPVDYIKNRVELEGLYDKATRNANIVSERLARHKRGDTLIKSLREWNGHTASNNPGFSVLLAYPFSPSFRSPEAIKPAPGRFVSEVLPHHQELRRILFKPRGLVYLDSNTAVFIDTDSPAGLQLDVYGHVAVGRLHPGQRPPALPDAMKDFHQCCQQFYLGQGYFGRVGLIYRFGDDTKDMKTERTACAAGLAQIDPEEIWAETERGLGRWDIDQRPR